MRITNQHPLYKVGAYVQPTIRMDKRYPPIVLKIIEHRADDYVKCIKVTNDENMNTGIGVYKTSSLAPLGKPLSLKI